MPGPAIGNASSGVHNAVRQLAATYFQRQGFAAVAKRHRARLSDAFGDDGLDPDVQGLPGVHLAVTSRLHHRFSSDLDAARRAADLNGSKVAALLQWRSERDIAEAYIVMTARDFSRLMGGTPPPP